MRTLLRVLIIVTIAVIFITQPVNALPFMSIPFASTAGGFTFTWPYTETGYLVTEFNNTNLARYDIENFALSFTPVADTFLDETAGSPALAQTSNQGTRYQRTYYFSDTSFF